MTICLATTYAPCLYTLLKSVVFVNLNALCSIIMAQKGRVRAFYAVNIFLPLRRRRLITFLPAVVAMRARKP